MSIEITTNLDEYGFRVAKENATESGYHLLGWATLEADSDGEWDHAGMNRAIARKFGGGATYWGEGEELSEDAAAFLIISANPPGVTAPLKRRGTMLTMTEKRMIGRYLRTRYESTNGRNVRFADDGAVSIAVDAMPNTNQPGRIFAGWDKDLLRGARRDA